MSDYPLFYLEWKRNNFGQVGPLLTLPDGTIVKDQSKVIIEHDPEGLAHVTVTFRVGADTVCVRQDFGDTHE